MSKFERLITFEYSAYIYKNLPEFEEEKELKEEEKELKEEEKEKPCEEELDEEKFWGIITLLGWRCRSEGVAKLYHIQRNLKPDEINYLKRYIDIFANHVEENIKKYGWLSKADPIQVKNFTYHVVGMGQQMYLGSITEPEFIQYMWDSNPVEYQDLYTMLQNC